MRFNHGWTQSDLAQRVGVSPRTIRNLEAGHRPHPRTAKLIADEFGCKPTDLWPEVALDLTDGAGLAS